jgi:hypothetical protein
MLAQNAERECLVRCIPGPNPQQESAPFELIVQIVRMVLPDQPREN